MTLRKKIQLSQLHLQKPDSIIGNMCQKLGITKDVMEHFKSYDNFFVLTNGPLLDLEDYRFKQSLTYQQFAEIINKLSLHKFSFDKKYYSKKIKENYPGLIKIEKEQKQLYLTSSNQFTLLILRKHLLLLKIGKHITWVNSKPK